MSTFVRIFLKNKRSIKVQKDLWYIIILSEDTFQGTVHDISSSIRHVGLDLLISIKLKFTRKEVSFGERGCYFYRRTSMRKSFEHFRAIKARDSHNQREGQEIWIGTPYPNWANDSLEIILLIQKINISAKSTIEMRLPHSS